MTTLVQTRIPTQTHARFVARAKARGISPYKLLRQLIQNEARQPTEPEGWETHRAWLDKMGGPELKGNAVVMDREEGAR